MAGINLGKYIVSGLLVFSDGSHLDEIKFISYTKSQKNYMDSSILI